MAHKHQREVGTSPCPNPECGELVEPGDLFCGACGYDLTAAPHHGASADRATVALGLPGGASAGRSPEPGGPRVSWPEAEPRTGTGVP
ncbi:zinc ribbon domain-containing protein, partial [Streptomyces fuscigenes]|nr:zinc ribbon domain-containing protein [Streptomyces fuscigenes]